MRALVVYDSRHGNTEAIALAIGEAVRGQARRVTDVSAKDLQGLDLLIVGSPTQGGWMTEAIRGMLKASPSLGGVCVAAFDTRTVSFWNRIVPFGYAAPRIAATLGRYGGKLLTPPEGFVVLGIRGPLKDGELERASEWARGMVA